MKRDRMGRRLALWLVPGLVAAVLSLAACGTSSAVVHVPTAAEVLQNATSVFDVNGTSAASANSATVSDLTFSLKFGADIKLSSPSYGTEDLTETMTGSGKETLHPRRDQASITLALGLGGSSSNVTANLSMNEVVDYATKVGYVQISGVSGLPGVSAGKWYKISFASLSGFGADTSLYTDYSKLTNAKLIGGETLNGVPVWHLRANENLLQALGALSGAGGSSSASSGLNMTATLDYYFRQDNYRPVKIVMVATYKDQTLGMMTINGEMDFTSFNTGITIALPPAKSTQPLNL